MTAVMLDAGTTTVTVTDSGGCAATSSVTLTQTSNLSLNVSLNSNVACNGESNGSATATAAGGTPAYSYLWDCLLYTSPSPRDLSTSRMPSSA